MVEIGERVRIGQGGVSVFTVTRVEGPHAWIESVEDVGPGRYPFRMRAADLVPIEPAT